MKRRLVAVPLVLVGGITVVVVVVARLAAPTEPVGLEATPSLSPRADLVDLNLRPWYVLTPIHPNQDSLVGFDLVAGTIGGRRVEISPRYGPLQPSAEMKGALPFATGPFVDTLLYGYWMGIGPELHALVPGTAKDRLLWSGPLIVHDAVLDTANQVVFFLAIDPESRQPETIFRLESDDLEVPLAVAELPPHPPDDAEESRADLVITPDATSLILLDCPAECTLRWFRAIEGERRGAIDLGGSFRIVGLSSQKVWLAPECGDVACPITTVALETGAAERFGFLCSAAVVVDSDRPMVVVSDGAADGDCVKDDYTLSRFDQPGASPVELAVFPDRALQLLELGENSGFGSPPGWVVLGPGGGLVSATPDVAGPGPYLIRVADGHRIALPPLRAN